MSTFTIYGSKKHSLKKLAIINNIGYTYYFISLAAMQFAFPLKRYFEIPTLNFVVFIVLYVGIFVFLLQYAKRLNKSLIEIGSLKTGINGLIKSIDEYIVSYPLDDIEKIKIKLHMSAFTFSKNINGNRTYLIQLKPKNAKPEQFVISHYSTERPTCTLKESLKKLEKISGKKII